MSDPVTFVGVIHHPSDKARFALVKLDSMIGPFSEAVISNNTIGWESVLHPFTGKIQEVRIKAEGYVREGQEAIVATKLKVIPFHHRS